MGNLGKKLLRKVKKEEEDDDDEEKDDKIRNEVRKEFNLKFEKKLLNIFLLK